MKTKKILLILLFPFMAEFLIACCHCDEPVVYKSYSNAAITLSHIDNAGGLPAIALKDSVVKTAYGIRLDIAVEKTAALSDRPSVFFNTANAFSCRCKEPLQYLAADSILDIKIVTDQGFNSDHPAGSDITQYFLLFRNKDFNTINEYLRERMPVFFTETEDRIFLDLLLMEAPTLNHNHQFKVQVFLSDNRILEQETTTIKLY